MTSTPAHARRLLCGHLYALWVAVFLASHAGSTLAQQPAWLTALDESVRSREDKALPAALSAAERALALFESASDTRKEDLSLVLTQLGRVYAELGDYGQAETYFVRALTADEEAYGPDSRKLETALMYLAGSYVDRRAYASAESTYLRLLRIKEKSHGSRSGENVEVLRAIATLYRLQGRFAEAESIIERTLTIWPVTVLGVKFDGTSHDLQNLAVLRVDAGRFEDAISLHLRALQLLERALLEAQASSVGPGNGTYWRLVNCLERLVRLSQRVGRHKEAAEFERRAEVYRSKISPPIFDIRRPANWGQAIFEMQL